MRLASARRARGVAVGFGQPGVEMFPVGGQVDGLAACGQQLLALPVPGRGGHQANLPETGPQPVEEGQASERGNQGPQPVQETEPGGQRGHGGLR